MTSLFTLRLSAALAGAAASLAMTPVQAQAPSAGTFANTPAVYLQGQWARHGTSAATVGLMLPWDGWSMALWGGQLRGLWDVYYSRWSFDRGPGGNDSLNLLGVTPTLRWYSNQGRSSWFVQAGIGLTYADHRYYTPVREFSTRFNFADHIGVGIHLGAQRRHELQLRIEHLSNAGIKHPNPGENFIQVRYALHY